VVTIRALLVPILMAFLFLFMPSYITGSNFNISGAAAQRSAPSASSPGYNTFEMDGQIGSLVLGMPPNTKTVDMPTIPRFILSGDWTMDVKQGNLTDFSASFYTGPVNGAENYIHQLSNFRVNNNTPIQLR
jgi:hypothetical protein